MGPFNTGIWSGNILSDPELRIGSVEDLNANGFSTLTTQIHQDVLGNGVWEHSGSLKGGCCTGPTWRGVGKRGVQTPDPHAERFQVCQVGSGAVCVWGGPKTERCRDEGVSPG